VSIPTDGVDADYVLKPRPWNLEALKRFMIVFGALSSVFDFLTFGAMLYLLRFSEEAFHTGWFLESLATQTLVIYIIRSAKIPWLQTRPSVPLILTSLLVLIMGFSLTALSIGEHFGFKRLPTAYYGILLVIIAFYLLIVESAKRLYSRKYAYD
jgi:Mg2+-importing ATPase